MTGTEEKEDFATLLVKWYLAERKANKDPKASDKGEYSGGKET